MMIPIPRAGVLRRVDAVDSGLEVPGIRSIEITTPLGATLRPVPEADRYLGFIFASGPDPRAVEQSLREAHSRLRIDIS
jgi:hypothetical protein